MSEQPILSVKKLTKVYRRSLYSREETFRLEADFTIETPQIVGVMGYSGQGRDRL